MKSNIKRLFLIALAVTSVSTFYSFRSAPGNRPFMGNEGKRLLDVHGAGAQRSDPKTGDPDRFSQGHGPQGDVVRINNFVRCVRVLPKAGEYPVVDTGQNDCYGSGGTGKLSPCPSVGEAFFGQDAQYRDAGPSYTDNGDGTITDKVTGLIWEKEFRKVSWKDSFPDAAANRTGGYSDWRVPNIKELYSLINFNGVTGAPMSGSVPYNAVPYIDTDYFAFEYPATGRFIDAQYISSTSYVGTVMNGKKAFFGVNLADGRIKGYPKSGNPMRETFYVRYVRGNVKYGANSFVDNGDGTITDKATGLMWMKVDSGRLNAGENRDGKLNWEEALKWAENLDYAGYSDWRLPNAKELHSIVDYSRSPGTTGSAAIDPLFSISSIKGSDGSKDFPFFWSSTTHLDGRNLGEYAVYFAFGEAEGYMGRPGMQRGGMRPQHPPRRN